MYYDYFPCDHCYLGDICDEGNCPDVQDYWAGHDQEEIEDMEDEK